MLKSLYIKGEHASLAKVVLKPSYLNISDFYLPRGVVFKLNNRNLLDECIESHLRKAGRLSYIDKGNSELQPLKNDNNMNKFQNNRRIGNNF